jgi:hypothetical protein
MQRQGWVRLEEIQRTSKGFTLLFGVYKGQRGRHVGAWRIECSRVHEARITDWDGGGITVYGSKHPAALQFAARQAEVRWTGRTDEDEPSTMAAVYRAHMGTVDDWIDFDIYSNIQLKAKNMRAYRGREFLMRCLCRGASVRWEASEANYGSAAEEIDEAQRTSFWSVACGGCGISCKGGVNAKWDRTRRRCSPVSRVPSLWWPIRTLPEFGITSGSGDDRPGTGQRCQVQCSR